MRPMTPLEQARLNFEIAQKRLAEVRAISEPKIAAIRARREALGRQRELCMLIGLGFMGLTMCSPFIAAVTVTVYNYFK